MEPFDMTLGTQVRTFSVEDDGSTLVIATADSAHPERPATIAYEQCESADESTAVLQKMVFDLQRAGWTLAE